MPEPMSQRAFKNFGARTSHSNRGMDFQSEIDAANGYYRLRALADVDRNANEWAYTSDSRWRTFPPELRATTGTGGRIVRVSSNVDYTGGGASFSVAFDAKECAQASIPLANFKEAQIERLVAKERCGVRAGFLVRFTRTGEVYWVAASKVREAFDRAKLQPKGKGAHPKSLSPDWLREHGVCVEEGRGAAMIRVDYLRAVAPELFVR
ncbi:MAG: Holliday junction resolvase RecU [Acidobacteriota bacterium]|nr:Holliday junction resolvase RecU [Acidobacteriota bacterium]